MSGFVATTAVAGAFVLAWSGVTKVRQPFETRRLLHRLGLPAQPLVARFIGLAELTLAGVALAVGGRIPALLLAGAYAVFAAVSVRSMSAGADSCGCFGDRSAPPGWVQVVTNVGCATAAAAWAVQGGDTIWGGPQPFTLTVFALLTARLVVALHEEMAMLVAAAAALRTQGVVT